MRPVGALSRIHDWAEKMPSEQMLHVGARKRNLAMCDLGIKAIAFVLVF